MSRGLIRRRPGKHGAQSGERVNAVRVRIAQVRRKREIGAAKMLLLEYAARLPGGDLDTSQFARELTTLPSQYSAPFGALYVAFGEDVALGCVAMRRLDASRGEVKRLFVKPSVRGLGIGRRLMKMLIRRARRIGYVALRLDTDVAMDEAKKLYRSLGFVPVAAYHDDPTGRLEFMELRLVPVSAPYRLRGRSR